MKKNIIILAFCTLVIGGLQATSFAMEVIPDAAVIARESARCQEILPGLQANLTEWARLAETTRQLPFFLQEHQYVSVVEVLESERRMNELFPLIYTPQLELL